MDLGLQISRRTVFDVPWSVLGESLHATERKFEFMPFYGLPWKWHKFFLQSLGRLSAIGNGGIIASGTFLGPTTTGWCFFEDVLSGIAIDGDQSPRLFLPPSKNLNLCRFIGCLVNGINSFLQGFRPARFKKDCFGSASARVEGVFSCHRAKIWIYAAVWFALKTA